MCVCVCVSVCLSVCVVEALLLAFLDIFEVSCNCYSCAEDRNRGFGGDAGEIKTTPSVLTLMYVINTFASHPSQACVSNVIQFKRIY